jgi:uncharacterized phiE125 gp8 family phage protein
MILTLTTPPAVEPISLAEARAHLRLDGSNAEPAPGSITAALAAPAAPGNVDNGAHRYRATFVTADGETEGGIISAAVTVSDKTVNGKVELTAIPLGGSLVTARKLYRTQAAGGTYLLLATLSDNTTAVYTDNIADSALGAGAPTVNTTVDPVLTAMVAAARQHMENILRRALITQTWKLYLNKFESEIEIPRAPLISVSSIKHFDTGGTEQTLAASVYTVDTDSEPGRIYLAPDQSWPDTDGREKAITITFVAGYGAAGSFVPAGIINALKLQLEILYDRPIKEYLDSIERARDALLAPYKVFTL